MLNLFWCLVAKLLARPAIADWLIARALGVSTLDRQLK
jgi:hypothetical protein